MSNMNFFFFYFILAEHKLLLNVRPLWCEIEFYISVCLFCQLPSWNHPLSMSKMSTTRVKCAVAKIVTGCLSYRRPITLMTD